MLVELSVMEQRYRAVLEVVSGVPVTEVAERYGVSRQAVHGWLGRYEREGLAGLADRSHRPGRQPRQMDARGRGGDLRAARVASAVGSARLVFELGGAVSPVPSRSTVYRVLVRNGLVEPERGGAAARTTSAGSARSRCSCGSWTSPASVFLADGTRGEA